MKSKSNKNTTSKDSLQALESENSLLREQLLQLHQDQAKTKSLQEQKDWLEQQHTQSEARFKTIFYQSMLGNKIIDDNLNIMQVNTSLLAMLGYKEEEITGTKITDITHPTCLSAWKELQHRLWNEEVPSFQMETMLKRKDGIYLWVHVTSIRFEEMDKRLGYTIIEDISARKLLERQLHHLYESQQTMMNIVAHDLRNPLFNISIASKYVKESLNGLPKPEVEQDLQPLGLMDIIDESCQRALNLIEEMLVMGEIRSHVSMELTDMKALILSLLPAFRLAAEKKGIQIHFDALHHPTYTSLDIAKFGRALSNLFTNATKFTPRGGKIFVRLEEAVDTIQLQIRDTGIGIPEALLGQIFDQFTKAGRRGTEHEKSIGLGLYIVKKIVELHDGHIRVESQENQGTSFYIRLKKE